MIQQRIHVIDSHTGGEPTRVVIDGGPDLGSGPLAERADVFRDKFDHLRSAIVNEPRGSDVLVGALLLDPADPACTAGVVFFNNVGNLRMCGHGTIGLMVTLAHLKRIRPGAHRIETPVGIVEAILHENGMVSVRNVPSHREARQVKVALPDGRVVMGDVAWGGNWFLLVDQAQHQLEISLANLERLTGLTWALRQAVNQQGYPDVDHVELFGPPADPKNDSRNFVLCPGKAYDRSPCGTGTSAKLACLHADEKLRPGRVWRQESILGSVFEGRVEVADGQTIPIITGSAHVTSDATLLLDDSDPFCHGI